MAKTTNLTTAVGTVVSMLGPATASAQQPRPASRPIDIPLAVQAAPPAIGAAVVQVLRGTLRGRNAVLVVTFADEAPPTPAGPRSRPTAIHLTLNGQELDFRDDGTAPDDRAGDGKYAALITLNPDSLRIDQLRVLAAVRKGLRPTVFRDRQIVGRAEIDTTLRQPPSPQAWMDTLIALRRDLRLPILREFVFRPGLIFPLIPFTTVDPATVDFPRSLIVNAPTVVGDPSRSFDPCTQAGNPNGVWTFKHAITGLANTPVTGISAEHFTRRWLRRWQTDLVVNDRPSLSRSGVSGFLDRWLTASGGTTLNLDRAPFRLLAFVNRIDLRENLTYGAGSAGEGRLVFGAVDPANPCAPLLFTVIFEYGITRTGCLGLKAWAQQWFDLRNFTLGTPQYNAALEAITEQFVAANTDPTQFPNRSSLNQLRTNEFLNSPWQLREFRLASDDADVGQLRQVTVKQNPRDDLNRQQIIADYVNANSALILLNRHVVPPEFPVPPGDPFLGPQSNADFADFWDGLGPNPSTAITVPDSRERFSLNTCDGCHTGETATLFTHIKPQVNPGTAGSLSAFLSGPISVQDPAGELVAGAPKVRQFDEPLRRQQSMADVLGQTCFAQILFRPLRMVH